MPSPIIVSTENIAFHTNPLDDIECRHIFKVNDIETLVTFRLPGSDRHPAFQYFLIWEQLRDFRTTSGLPIPQNKLLELWGTIVRGDNGYITTPLWTPIRDLFPLQSLPEHIATFLSLVHYFGFGADTIDPPTCIPNRVRAGDCLASYLRRDLRYDITMTPSEFLAEFKLALRFLASLELLWEPPITTTEQTTIFLYSFPHHMVLHFCTSPDSQVDPTELTMDHIAARMDSILNDERVSRPARQPHRFVMPHQIPVASNNDFVTDEREPILPIGPTPQNGFPVTPICLGGIPDCLALSLADPDLFAPDLSDDNPDGTIQAYLFWRDLPQHQQPPATLMHRHFNDFIERELHILYQQEDHLRHWHHRVLGAEDHERRCTLEWVARKFTSDTPNPNLTVDNLTDAERTHFNHLLNCAYATYCSRVSYYNDRWSHAREHNAATPWLDYDIRPDRDQPPELYEWTDPSWVPNIDWASWIAWAELQRPSSRPRLHDTSTSSFPHDFQPDPTPAIHLQQFTSRPPNAPPYLLPRPAFTASYSLPSLSFYDWLVRHRASGIYTPSLDDGSTPFTFSIPGSSPPSSISGTLPIIRPSSDSISACHVAILFDDIISTLTQSPAPALTDDDLSFLWYQYVLSSTEDKRLFRTAYAAATSNLTPLCTTFPATPPTFRQVRSGFLSLHHTDGSFLNAGDSLRLTLRDPPKLPRNIPIHTFTERYNHLASITKVLLGYYEQDLSHHDLNTSFISAFPNHFRDALSRQPPPRTHFKDTTISSLAAFFTSYESTFPSHAAPNVHNTQPQPSPRFLTTDHLQSFASAPLPTADSTATPPHVSLRSYLLPSIPPEFEPYVPPDSDDDSLFSTH